MTDLRSVRPLSSQPTPAIRGDEVAILREAIATEQARVVELLQRVQAAEQGETHYKRLYRSMLMAYAEVARERDDARAHAQAIGEQAPVWESGPS